MLDAQLSRRTVLGGGVAAGVTAALGGVGTLLTAVPGTTQANGNALIGFQSVPALPDDGITDTIRGSARVQGRRSDRLGRPGVGRS
jgi:secreted PhoX family phosphatase